MNKSNLLATKGITQYLTRDEIEEGIIYGNVDGVCPHCYSILEIEIGIIANLSCPNCIYKARVRKNDNSHVPIITK